MEKHDAFAASTKRKAITTGRKRRRAA